MNEYQEKRQQIGILIFDEVEVLDFTGPFEVFSLATTLDNKKLFDVNTISETGQMISARNGLKVLPTFKISDNYDFDILIIPGGYGAEEIQIKNIELLNWIKAEKQKVKILASVCTGALLLAECGLLDNQRATTHWMDLDRLDKDYPNVNVVRNVKFVDEGSLITSGGISAGINMSFHILKKLYGSEVARHTAKRMEYDIEIE